jgi:hypothetical protein
VYSSVENGNLMEEAISDILPINEEMNESCINEDLSTCTTRQHPERDGDVFNGDDMAPHAVDSQSISVGRRDMNCGQTKEQAQYDVESLGGRMMSPPAVVHHVDYRSKAEDRKAELDALRRKSLAKPQGEPY